MGLLWAAKWMSVRELSGGADNVRTILTQTDIFDEARVDQAVAKMSLELQSALRDGGTVARMALRWFSIAWLWIMALYWPMLLKEHF